MISCGKASMHEGPEKNDVQAVLADSGLCPLTKQPLRWEALTVLTHGNIERYRALIRNAS